ncbi:MAG TPA: hypothetical protein DCW90_04810 [Lachnospiraceae bacterium]|nr:hypothetical protein [Lachnospiraceae bacterium]
MPIYQRTIHPKPSGYLHYWSANIDDNILSTASAMYNINKREILASQYSHYVKSQSNKISKASVDGMSMQALGKLYDVGLYRDELEKYVNMEKTLSQPSGDLEILPLEQAMARAKSIDLTTANNSIAQYVQSLEDFLNTTLKPTKTNLTNLQTGLIYEYANTYGLTKSNNLTNNQISRTCERILRDILSNENGKFFKVRKGTAEANAGITTAYKKIAATAYALKHFQGQGFPIKRALVQYGDSSKRREATSHTVSGADAILNELSNKITGSMENVKAGAAETVRVFGSLELAKKFFQQIDKNIIISNQHIGNRHNSIDINVSTNNNTIFKKAINELNLSEARLSVKTSKPDNSFYVSQNGVTAGVTFTVKEGEGLKGPLQAVNNSTIRLQSGTPLLTLLAREAGFTSGQLFAVYQMLVAHGNEVMLDNWWEHIKETANDLAFLDALAGLSQEDRATFMVVGDRIARVQDILMERMASGVSNISSTLKTSRWNKGSLSRTPYMALNEWEGNNKPNTQDALSRSTKVFKGASDLLYATKIQIDMTIKNTQTLLNLFGR